MVGIDSAHPTVHRGVGKRESISRAYKRKEKRRRRK
jgi:hypothetical protein